MGKDSDNDLEKARAKVIAAIERLKITTSVAEAQSLLGSIEEIASQFPELAGSVGPAREYAKTVEVLASSISTSNGNSLGSTNGNLWERFENELTKAKADIETEYEDFYKHYNQLNSKDINEASAAMAALLQENTAEKLDSFTEKAIKPVRLRMDMIQQLEDSLRKNGSQWSEEMRDNIRYKIEALREENDKERRRYDENIRQRMGIQVAEEFARELAEEGLIKEDDGHKNAVRVHRAISEEASIQQELNQIGKDVGKAAFSNPSDKSICSREFRTAKEKLKDKMRASYKDFISQKVDAERAKEEAEIIASKAIPQQTKQQGQAKIQDGQLEEQAQRVEAQHERKGQEEVASVRAQQNPKSTRPTQSQGLTQAPEQVVASIIKKDSNLQNNSQPNVAGSESVLTNEEIMRRNIEKIKAAKAAKKAQDQSKQGQPDTKEVNIKQAGVLEKAKAVFKRFTSNPIEPRGGGDNPPPKKPWSKKVKPEYTPDKQRDPGKPPTRGR